MPFAGWLIAACCGALLALGAVRTVPPGQPQTPTLPPSASPEQQARASCTGCHAFPQPDILPKSAWRAEVVKMLFIREKRLPPLGSFAAVAKRTTLPPDLERALEFYAANAPERLPAPDAWPAPGESPVIFQRRALSMQDMPGPPAVSHVALVDMDGDGRLETLGSDMRHGVIFSDRGAQEGKLSAIATIQHPSNVLLTDLDGDKQQDLLVGDLGEFFPADHERGAVILLRGLGNGKFGSFWLDGWPRVASVRAADFNGDGRNDLAVAAFGWQKVGRVAILENQTEQPARPVFKPHTIDPRTGSIDVIPVDLNRDGKMDFVTLLAQEHESVVAYLNKGSGFEFEQKLIYAAPHPNWGSSGLELVDLDKDGDVDVLLAHGDTFDDGIVKPYHGIQWLENTGAYPFAERTIARMPGVHSAKAADLDGDGDLDIAAAALLAGGADVDEKTLPALAWLEQTAKGVFVRHTIELGTPRYSTLDVGDLDADGDIDIVTGTLVPDELNRPWVEIWRNERRRAPGLINQREER
jgi:FG-GAP-like repeat